MRASPKGELVKRSRCKPKRMPRRPKETKVFLAKSEECCRMRLPRLEPKALTGSLTDRSSNACGHLRTELVRTNYRMLVLTEIQ